MNLFNLPGMNGFKTAVAGWSLLVVGVGKLLVLIGECVGGSRDLNMCFQEVPAAFDAIVTAAMGLGILGLGHKLTKTDGQ